MEKKFMMGNIKDLKIHGGVHNNGYYSPITEAEAEEMFKAIAETIRQQLRGVPDAWLTVEFKKEFGTKINS